MMKFDDHGHVPKRRHIEYESILLPAQTTPTAHTTANGGDQIEQLSQPNNADDCATSDFPNYTNSYELDSQHDSTKIQVDNIGERQIPENDEESANPPNVVSIFIGQHFKCSMAHYSSSEAAIFACSEFQELPSITSVCNFLMELQPTDVLVHSRVSEEILTLLDSTVKQLSCDCTLHIQPTVYFDYKGNVQKVQELCQSLHRDTPASRYAIEKFQYGWH